MKTTSCRILLGIIAVFMAPLVTQAVTITWTNISGGDWNVAANWNPNQVPGPVDLAVITADGIYTVTLNTSNSVRSLTVGGSNGVQTLTLSGTLTVSDNATFNVLGILNLVGGTLGGAGYVELRGTNTWSSGIIQGPGILTNASGGILIIATGNDHDIPARILFNQGTVLHTGGRIRGGNGHIVNNNSLWVEQEDTAFNSDYGGFSTFYNNGTLQKTAGTGYTQFDNGYMFNNPGLVQVQSGQLNISGGGSSAGTFNSTTPGVINFNSIYSFNSSTFTGNGTNRLNGSSTLNGTITTTANFEFLGGDIRGTNVLVGMFKWNGGIFFGPGTTTISPGSTLLITSSADHDLSQRTLNNNGTVIHTGGNIRGGNGHVIKNTGLWQEQSNGEFTNAFAGPTSIFTNTGTFQKTVATGTTTFQPGYSFNNNGVADIQTGVLTLNSVGNSSGTFSSLAPVVINFNTNHTFKSGVTFSGTGTNRLNAGTNVLIGNITAQNLEFAGATLTGTNTLIGNVNWISGTLNGPGTTTIAPGGTFWITGAVDHDLPQRILNNNGTVTHTDGNIRGGNGHVIKNTGLWQEQSNAEFTNAFSGGIPISIFTNSGTFQKTVATGDNHLSTQLQFYQYRSGGYPEWCAYFKWRGKQFGDIQQSGSGGD